MAYSDPHQRLTPAEVEHAYRALRRQRIGWMVVSTVISIVVSAHTIHAIAMAAPWPLQGAVASVAVPVAIVALAVVLDVFVVFPWGVAQFDLGLSSRPDETDLVLGAMN